MFPGREVKTLALLEIVSQGLLEEFLNYFNSEISIAFKEY